MGWHNSFRHVLSRKLSTEELMLWIVVLEKMLESPSDCKEVKPVNPRGNQSWRFVGRTDAEAETPILWPSDEKNWLIGKYLNSGKTEGRRRRVWQRMRWLDGITDSMDISLCKLLEWLTGKPGVLRSMELQRVGYDWATELIIRSLFISLCVCVSCSVVSYSLWSHRLYLTRVLCLWNSPGKNTGVGFHFLIRAPVGEIRIGCFKSKGTMYIYVYLST